MANLSSKIGATGVVTESTTQTLTNKTLTSPVIDTSISGTAIASQAEAEAGSSSTKVMTPLRVSQAIAALVPSAGWEYVSTTTISGSPTSVVWTGLDMSTYDYCLLLNTIGWQVDTAYFVLDFSTNNGSTYITKTTSNTGANYARGSGVTGSSGANSHFGMCSVSPSLHGLIFIENFSNGVAVKSELYEASSGSSQRGAMITLCSVNSVNAFKFYDYFASRTFDNTGSIELYRREKGIPT